MHSKKPKIVITGPESCGKSVLAAELADRLGWHLVPEVARSYLKDRVGYALTDVIRIGQLQRAEELKCPPDARGLVCDTDASVIWVWCKVRYGFVPRIVQAAMDEANADLYLICYPDLPWEADPLREHPHERLMLFELYSDLLGQKPHAIVTGEGGLRTNSALRAIDQIKNGPEGPF